MAICSTSEHVERWQRMNHSKDSTRAKHVEHSKCSKHLQYLKLSTRNVRNTDSRIARHSEQVHVGNARV
eukprot:11195244-Lingulodinium_polyedra.AAC.1